MTRQALYRSLCLALGDRPTDVCSGDPFWYGAGSIFAESISSRETIAIPAPSTFAWAAARLRWRLEDTVTLGLHARPIELLRPHLRTGARLIVLVRDGAATAQSRRLSRAPTDLGRRA